MTLRVCVLTATRAEYGLLQWLMRDIEDAPDLTLQLVVTGSHLSPMHGSTVEAIRADGFSIDAEVESLLASDSGAGAAKAMGLVALGLADAFSRLEPDLLVILGDRTELLAAAGAATAMRLPILHIHGGEITTGAIDDAIRHAVTKLASVHFVAAAEYARRVEQMGEPPDRIHVVGAPGLDHLGRTSLLTRAEVERRISMPLGDTSFLVTYHPVTVDRGRESGGLAELLAALDEFPEARMVLTGPNADPGAHVIRRQLEVYAAERSDRVSFHASLGQQLYLSTLRAVDVVIGNSSSGIIEAPAVGTATVNVGSRQDGRLRAGSVIDCEPAAGMLASAVRRALELPSTAFEAPPYGRGGASARMLEVIRTVVPDQLLAQRFIDLEWER